MTEETLFITTTVHTPRLLLKYQHGEITVADDLTPDESRWLIKQLAIMLTSRTSIIELTIEEEE
jgi:hypothetical protein